MNIKILGMLFLGFSHEACVDYYDIDLDGIEVKQLVESLDVKYVLSASPKQVIPKSEFTGQFPEVNFTVQFSNGFESFIKVEMYKFNLIDENGKTENLLTDLKTDGPSNQYVQGGDKKGQPIGRHSFSSRFLEELPEGKYSIYINGKMCMGEQLQNCYPFDRTDEVELVFKGIWNAPT